MHPLMVSEVPLQVPVYLGGHTCLVAQASSTPSDTHPLHLLPYAPVCVWYHLRRSELPRRGASMWCIPSGQHGVCVHVCRLASPPSWWYHPLPCRSCPLAVDGCPHVCAGLCRGTVPEVCMPASSDGQRDTSQVLVHLRGYTCLVRYLAHALLLVSALGPAKWVPYEYTHV